MLSKAIIGVTALCGMTFGSVRDNAANTGFQMLEEPIGARQTALGGAGSGLSGNGFAYYNPALPLLGSFPYVNIDYGGYPAADLRRAHFETAWPMRTWYCAASVTTASIEGIYPATIHGVNWAAPGAARLTSLTLAGGFALRSRAAAGITINGIQDRIVDDVAYALSFGLGGAAWIIPGRFSAGAALLNAGTSTSYIDTVEHLGSGAALPLTARAGIAWHETFRSIGLVGVADVVYRHTDKRIMVPLGLEISPLSVLSLRAGKRFNHDTEMFNFGAGLAVAPLNVDMAFVIPRLGDDAELKWLVGITYSLGRRPGSRGGEKAAPDATSTSVPPQPVLRPATDSSPPQPAAPDTTSAQAVLPTEASDSASQETPAVGDTVPSAQTDTATARKPVIVPAGTDSLPPPQPLPVQPHSLTPDSLQTSPAQPVPAGDYLHSADSTATGAPLPLPPSAQPEAIPSTDALPADTPVPPGTTGEKATHLP